nr:prenyltransferase/squalene oxidase repeat-containing protein [Candidatus Thiodictyon syntrophicum]
MYNTATYAYSKYNAVTRGMEWVESAQHDSGGWGSIPGCPRPRVYPTAFALRFLSEFFPSSPAVRAGLAWLRSAQNGDGGWGALPGTDPSAGRASTSIHTAHAILALLAGGQSADDEQVEKALNYLDATFHPAEPEPWPSTSEMEVVDTDAAIDFRHSSTPWVLAALLAARRPISSFTCVASMQWLLHQQHTLGYWSSVLTPGHEPIWATHDALYALNAARQTAIENVAELLIADFRKSEIDLAWTRAFSGFDQAKGLAAYGRSRPSKWLYIWNSALTFFVCLLLLMTLGETTKSISVIGQVLGSLGVALVAGFVPFLYQLAAEEFKLRRIRE